MEQPQPDLYGDLRQAVSRFGIQVLEKKMDEEKPGEFDGLTITINIRHSPEAASYYLAHSCGSIFQWCTDFEEAQKVFANLRRAKRKTADAPGFELALERYRLFEQTSSEHAVWLIHQAGHEEAIRPYTVFFRADIEAMVVFHRTGKAPAWPEFFGEWKRRVESGEIRVVPFIPRRITPFRPIRIDEQKVLQERD